LATFSCKASIPDAGFNISLYSTDTVQNPRSLAVADSNGTVIVYASSNGAGVVTAIVNSTGTPKACTLIRGLNNPEGLVYTNGSLFVGQVMYLYMLAP
jgi:hypothetical protein